MGIQLLHSLRKPVPGKQGPHPLLCRNCLSSGQHLFSDFHQRIQPCHALGHQGDARHAVGFPCFFSSVPDASFQKSVGWQQAQHRMGQKAFSRSAGSHHRHDFSPVNRHVQAGDHRKKGLPEGPPPASAFVLPETDGKILDGKKLLFFHYICFFHFTPLLDTGHKVTSIGRFGI